MAATAAIPRFAIFVVATTFLIIEASLTLAEEASVTTEFSYLGATGPEKWGSLNPAFSACSDGKSQSPIDIARGKVVLNPNLKPLTRQYNLSTNSILANHGFSIELRCGENSGILVSDGKTYKFKQLHWHSPSEHRIHGLQYAAELHLVHVADDGSKAVVAVLYRLGHADPLIAKIKNQLRDLAKQQVEGEVSVGRLSLKQLTQKTPKYYKYVGSLTTPPCTQPVVWHILGKIRSISPEQLEALKAPLNLGCKNNSRPVQPLNGRLVQLYMRRKTTILDE